MKTYKLLIAVVASVISSLITVVSLHNILDYNDDDTYIIYDETGKPEIWHADEHFKH